MTSQALGLIETVGLPPAIEAADAAVKLANVSLSGYEKTRGGGLVTVKLRGDVGAVQAAVEAGVAAASRVGKVFSSHVIPRPHSDTEILIAHIDRGVCRAERVPLDAGMAATAPATVPESPAAREAVALPPVETVSDGESGAPHADDVCNLCGDPVCPRRKRQLRKLCIHYATSEQQLSASES